MPMGYFFCCIYLRRTLIGTQISTDNIILYLRFLILDFFLIVRLSAYDEVSIRNSQIANFKKINKKELITAMSREIQALKSALNLERKSL